MDAERQRDERRARRLAYLGYAAQGTGALLYVFTIWIEVLVDTQLAREVAIDWLSESHRRWRLRTTVLFLVWTILGGITLPYGIGWLCLPPAFAWYAYRVALGLWRLQRGRPVGVRIPALAAAQGSRSRS